jgi:protein TonB
VKKEEVKPPTPPVVKPPEIKPPELVIPPPVIATATARLPTVGSIDSLLRGSGGGSGNDGSMGNGPGSGGGIGSGVGTGRGSGTGPGTGGGDGDVYLPKPQAIFVLPDELAARLRPYEMEALFSLDSTGKVLGIKFNKSGDRGFDRQVENMLKEVRWYPAFDLYGRAVASTGKLTFTVK